MFAMHPAYLKDREAREAAYAVGRAEFTDLAADHRVQYHADQRPETLASFSAEQLDTHPSYITVVPKSNSNRLSGRTWRCEHGVLDVRTGDTTFRARLQGWMDCLREHWLDSPSLGA
jgi:hypothetical protein